MRKKISVAECWMKMLRRLLVRVLKQFREFERWFDPVLAKAKEVWQTLARSGLTLAVGLLTEVVLKP